MNNAIFYRQSDLKKLFFRIKRRLFYELKNIILRVNFFLFNKFIKKYSYRLEDYDEDLNVFKPGNPKFFKKKINFFKSENAKINRIYNHEYQILSKKFFNTNISEPKNLDLIREAASELPFSEVEKYKPIDWHCDFKSKTRWNEKTFYLDIPLKPSHNSDIKIPRELSRFQHIQSIFFSNDERASTEFFLQVIDWITSNPFKRGVNWACTMDVSIRAINWIWGIRFFENELKKKPKIRQIIFDSLIEHGKHIYDNLEYYEENTGNHYLSNISGLIYISGLLPKYTNSDNWLIFGLHELISEMDREVYDDGFTHEASTFYHRLVTEIFLSTASLVEKMTTTRRKRISSMNFDKLKTYPKISKDLIDQLDLGEGNQILPKAFYKKLKKMVDSFLSIHEPNGLIPQIGDNDSARLHKISSFKEINELDHSHIFAVGGEIFKNKKFKSLGQKFKVESNIIAGDFNEKNNFFEDNKNPNNRFFKNFGLGILKNKKAWVSITCGTNGQNKLGGHGHNDKNSIELNINNYDFIVDGGCPVYTSNPKLRNEYRSSSFHSTLSIENMEQDTWIDGVNGLFALREISKRKLSLINNSARGFHNGFGAPHIRKLYLDEHKLTIYDFCKFKSDKFLLFNFHPNVFFKDSKLYSETFQSKLSHNNLQDILIEISNVKNFDIVEGRYSLGFGKPKSNIMLKVEINANFSKTIFSW